MPSDGKALFALRIALSFAGSLAIAEAIGPDLAFMAPLIAVALAASPGPPLAAAVALPLMCWVLAVAVSILVNAFALSAPLVYAMLTLVGLWGGFQLSTSPKTSVVGMVVLVLFAILPMQLVPHPEASQTIVYDLAKSILIGSVTAWLIGLVLPGPPPRTEPQRLYTPMPVLTAALTAWVGAYLVWFVEPPGAAPALIGMIIVLRADETPGFAIARDRFAAALLGGPAAVVASSVVMLAPVLLTLFLAALLLAWPLALRVARGDERRGMAIKSLNVLAVLTAQEFSPLFEDTQTRLWVRIVGVMIGIAYASLALALLAPRHRQSLADTAGADENSVTAAARSSP